MPGMSGVLKMGFSFHTFAGIAWLALTIWSGVHLDTYTMKIFLHCASDLEVLLLTLFFGALWKG